VDTVHQGDREGVKGVYHINAVDEVTQWQVVGCTPAISEAWLEPLLGSMLQQFPFVIQGFHSDNGSGFVNHTVANLLGKLLIEQTKSRPRHSNDNGLVEAKNGAVIRKHMGYGHVAAPHAKRIQQFYEESFNAYLNLHRPCAQADVEVDAKGKQKRGYRRYQTPLETLLALPNPQQYLCPGVTVRSLREQARRQSDTQAHNKCNRPSEISFWRCDAVPAGNGNDGRMESDGKPKTGFPSLSTGLGNRLRDSHIPTATSAISCSWKGEPKPRAPTTFCSGSFFDEKILLWFWLCRRKVRRSPSSQVERSP
jgi:hypothetical protein